MLSLSAKATLERKAGMGATPRSGYGVTDDDAITRHFRNNCPTLLDGMPPRRPDQGGLLREALKALERGRVDPALLPADILRETLDEISADARPSASAGLTAVSSGQVHVWWSPAVLDNLDDVLARLGQPRTVLRFYDITGLDPDACRWHETFDLDVELADYGHSARLMRGDRTYVVDLGCVYADGRFLRLARTNSTAVPRNGRGAPDTGQTARCLAHHPAADLAEAHWTPDAAARKWVGRRVDSPERDIEAEMLVHMVYRAFLKEGARAVRQAPGPIRRDAAALEREYFQRERELALPQDIAVKGKVPVFLVVRLDAERHMPSIRRPAPPPLVPVTAAWKSSVNRDRHVLHSGILAAAKAGRLIDVLRYFAHADSVARVEGKITEAHGSQTLDIPVTPELTASLYSSPVFEAARNLSETLTDMRILELPGMKTGVEVARTLPPAQSVGRDTAVHRYGDESGETDPERAFGGSEAKRMAKAGVRITRMALTLEGRMRPGARLKVAGKLVHADANGCFRLECVLSGKKASIPMRAGVSVGGEARSLISVEWEKRASGERKKA